MKTKTEEQKVRMLQEVERSMGRVFCHLAMAKRKRTYCKMDVQDQEAQGGSVYTYVENFELAIKRGRDWGFVESKPCEICRRLINKAKRREARKPAPSPKALIIDRGNAMGWATIIRQSSPNDLSVIQ